MAASVDNASFAWQPLTPQGIASFAQARQGRLLIVQLLAALCAAFSIAWLLRVAWFPVVTNAVEHLPAQGVIQSGRLNWGGQSPQALAENRFLAIAVDLEHAGHVRSPAHVQVELGSIDFRVYSLFGLLEQPYPKQYVIPFNFQELKPWWGAWQPMFLALTVVIGVFALLASWTALATIYCVPVWVTGLYFNRELTLGGSWRLAGAALMPGALVMIIAIVCYGTGGLDLVRLITAAALHFVLGWVYLAMGTMAAPKLRAGLDLKTNPFIKSSEQMSESAPSKAARGLNNPFRSSDD